MKAPVRHEQLELEADIKVVSRLFEHEHLAFLPDHAGHEHRLLLYTGQRCAYLRVEQSCSAQLHKNRFADWEGDLHAWSAVEDLQLWSIFVTVGIRPPSLMSEVTLVGRALPKCAASRHCLPPHILGSVTAGVMLINEKGTSTVVDQDRTKERDSAAMSTPKAWTQPWVTKHSSAVRALAR
jgi:hypothetical protein